MNMALYMAAAQIAPGGSGRKTIRLRSGELRRTGISRPPSYKEGTSMILCVSERVIGDIRIS